MSQDRQPPGASRGGQRHAAGRGEASASPVDPSDGSAWFVGEEAVAWTEEPDELVSRRQRQLARGPYRAAVPPFIAGLPVALDSEVAAEAAEAMAELSRFDAEMALGFGDAEVSPLPSVLLRSESASSSQIEQITAGARALALAGIGESTGPNAALVNANADAMTTALALSDDLSAEAIIDVQRALLVQSNPEYTGKFRDDPVWIGGKGSTPHTASFVPPVAERVPALIDDLVLFTQRTDVNAFAQIAIAHAQFETVHPFSDGNGRTGRALAHSMLRHYGITRRVTVPISAGLLADVDDYYEALNAYRRGDLSPIVAEFSRAAFAASNTGRSLVADLQAIRDSWLVRVEARRDAAVWAALPVVMAQPAITVGHLADRLSISFTSAQNAIVQMVKAQVLTPVGAQKRNRVWTANEVVEALDDFAKRVGKRRLGR